jgi:hypothetical protein
MAIIIVGKQWTRKNITHAATTRFPNRLTLTCIGKHGCLEFRSKKDGMDVLSFDPKRMAWHVLSLDPKRMIWHVVGKT